MALLAFPTADVIWILPVVAPLGTLALMMLAVSLMTVAFTPLKVTLVTRVR